MQVFFILACASNVESPTKFIVNDNTKVSVLTNFLNVTGFETKVKDKRANLICLPRSKQHTLCCCGI